MLGLDQRALRIAWTVFLFCLSIALIYAARGVIIVFALALFLAHLLSPLVILVDRMTPRRVPRTVALALVYMLIIALLASAIVPLGSAIAGDAANLARRLPEAFKDDPASHLPLPGWLEPLRSRLVAVEHDRLDSLGRDVGSIVSKTASGLATGLGTIVSAVLIPILAFFFIKDSKEIRDAIIESFHDDQRPLVDEILTDLGVLLAQYVRALVILAAATFVFYVAFLLTTGAPYAVLLAGLAAGCEFVPAVGPAAAALVILIVTTIGGYTKWVFLLGFFAVYRIFQDYILQPALMSAGVQVHPLMVLFGALAGAEIAGIPGIFFSVPVIAALRIIFVRLRRQLYAVTASGQDASPPQVTLITGE